VAGGTLLAALGYLVASQFAFDTGTVLNVSAPLLAVLLSGAAVLVLGSVGAERERQRLRKQFAAFSPDLVGAVLAGDGAPLASTAVIGGYRIETLVGRGGMAAVYRATQLALDRPVALKLIAAAAAREPVYRERFLRESRLAASVEHPSVIPIYEAGDDGGLLFIAMRYVDGVDLDAVLRRLGPLAPADAVRVVGQIAGALDAAHARGLVHRDVKPGNVLLDVDLEHAYLADFGVAGVAGARSELTVAGGFIGTVNYAAPEQAAGVDVDHRADIYALGGLLFHALTGERPYVRDSMAAMMAAHAGAPVPVPSSLNPALRAFDSVIARAMAKLPGDRFASARELATAARDALGSTSVSSA
jgi:serine/threonine protein kinase